MMEKVKTQVGINSYIYRSPKCMVCIKIFRFVHSIKDPEIRTGDRVKDSNDTFSDETDDDFICELKKQNKSEKSGTE